jgi:hypothetical protein
VDFGLIGVAIGVGGAHSKAYSCEEKYGDLHDGDGP